MGTAFSCRENLEDKGIFCQQIILAYITFMPNQKFLGKAYFAKNALFDG